jgi:hypothetical protein
MMRRFLALLIAAVLVFPTLVLAADTDASPSWDYYQHNAMIAVYHVVADDSGALSNPDTSHAIPVFPYGMMTEMPDYIALHGTFTEIGSNASGDSVIVNIDVNPEADSTSLSKASALWTIISHTAGDAVYANRTGKADTLVTGTSDGSITATYAFTSTQMTELMPYFRIRWDYSEGAAVDSFDVDWRVVYLWDDDD